jgi:hypothetical protein
MSEGCDLCEAAIITTRYFDDETCWIADCEICRVPMVVWKVHDPSPPQVVKDIMHQSLSRVANEVLGEGEWSLDDHMRKIPDHYHAHARRSFAWNRVQA